MTSAFLDLYSTDFPELEPSKRVAFAAFIAERALLWGEHDKRLDGVLKLAWELTERGENANSIISSSLDTCEQIVPDLDDPATDDYDYWIVMACSSVALAWKQPSGYLNSAAECMAALFASQHNDLDELEAISPDCLPPDAYSEYELHLEVARALFQMPSGSTRKRDLLAAIASGCSE